MYVPVGRNDLYDPDVSRVAEVLLRQSFVEPDGRVREEISLAL